MDAPSGAAPRPRPRRRTVPPIPVAEEWIQWLQPPRRSPLGSRAQESVVEDQRRLARMNNDPYHGVLFRTQAELDDNFRSPEERREQAIRETPTRIVEEELLEIAQRLSESRYARQWRTQAEALAEHLGRIERAKQRGKRALLALLNEFRQFITRAQEIDKYGAAPKRKLRDL